MIKRLNLIAFVTTIFLLVNCKPNSKEKALGGKGIEDSTKLKTDTPKIDEQRFEDEIQRFEGLDLVNGPMEGGVLFTGSSSIRLWSTLEEDMSGFTILNRGFGGSTIPEVVKYAPRYLWKHHPEVIVFYCGENDINDGATPEMVYKDFVTFADLVEEKLPGTKMVYISMKPSLARWALWEKFQTGDRMIRAFIDGKVSIEFMDSGSSMLTKNGTLKLDIFVEDGLHMNAEGYKGWARELQPILKKILSVKRV